ncbi:MAG: hypothetical protein DDT19_02294 [Syntrophomonadaceae bacterium]|nr:hypothetical protein [Bacillota bacterium]
MTKHLIIPCSNCGAEYDTDNSPIRPILRRKTMPFCLYCHTALLQARHKEFPQQIEWLPIMECKNPESYGILCVPCNQCGRFTGEVKWKK